MVIDASNVVITTIAEDPATGDTVTIVDGVETKRIPPAPEKVVSRELITKLKAFKANAGNNLTALQTQLTKIDADITAAIAERDAAQVVIDNVASTAAQKTQARIDKAIAIVKLDGAKAGKLTTQIGLDNVRSINALLRLQMSDFSDTQNT
jgi:hypothetical protein